MTRGRVRAAAGLAAVVVLLALAGCGGGGGNGAVNASGYSFLLAPHWQQLPTPKGMVAAYRRDDHSALLTIRRTPGSPVITKAFLKTLDLRFHERLPGYVPLGAKIVDTRAGGVFLFTYTQKKSGKLTTIAVVPVQGKGYSFVLDAVMNSASATAGHDIVQMINSFAPAKS